MRGVELHDNGRLIASTGQGLTTRQGIVAKGYWSADCTIAYDNAIVVKNIHSEWLCAAGDILSLISIYMLQSIELTLTIKLVTSLQREQTPMVVYGSVQVQFPLGHATVGRNWLELKLYRPR
jgi:hypothetical protein